jgi:tRNA (mo5U34)-methyltransferase
MPADSVREARRRQDFLDQLAAKGWYHSFDLPDGTRIDGYISLEALRERYARFPIPADLTGKRVLDIGAWDGWFSFEAERRGASVTALDCVELASFREIQAKLGSRTDYRTLDVYDLPGAGLGRFDYAFFLGVVYHLKHPLLGLEIVCALTRETALVDSFVTDGDTWQDRAGEIPVMEFYETDELAGRLDNWHGPSVSCLMALCRAAGFARVELLYAGGHHASVACHRRWEPVPDGALEPPPDLITVVNHADFGINFTARGDQYLTCWFNYEREDLDRTELRLDVDGLGAPALFLRREECPRWVANFRLPPGLESGWQEVRLRLAGSPFGQAARIAVDIPLHAERLMTREVCGGRSWGQDRLQAADEGMLSLWVAGLPENADRANVRVYLADTRLAVDYVSPPDNGGFRQVNARVPNSFPPGDYPLRLTFGPAEVSHLRPVRVGE